VQRSKEKLKQELSRKQIRGGGEHFVETIDPGAVDQLARAMVAAEDMTADLNAKLEQLDELVTKEDDRKSKLEVILKAAAKIVKTEDDQEDASKDQKDGDDAEAETEETKVKEEGDPTPKKDDAGPSPKKEEEDTEKDTSGDDRAQLETELGQLTLQKQRLLFEISRLMPRILDQQDAVESQRRHLNYVKSDISTDKTVCEVSGNFMSSRDADERIAAHYAGKQYQGWKLVRDKLAEMKAAYGPHGPPPPVGRGPPPPGRGPPMGGGGRGPPPGPGGYGRDRGVFDNVWILSRWYHACSYFSTFSFLFCQTMYRWWW